MYVQLTEVLRQAQDDYKKATSAHTHTLYNTLSMSKLSLRRMLRRLWRLVFWTSLSLSVLVGGLLGLGYVYQDDIEAYVAGHLVEYLDADVYIGEIDVSFLHSWPDIEVQLLHVEADLPEQIAKANRFEDRQLLQAQEVNFTIDLLSFFSNRYVVKEIALLTPSVHLTQNEGGLLNWNLMLQPVLNDSTQQDDDTAAVSFKLSELSTRDARVFWTARGGEHLAADSLDLTFSGDFSEDTYAMALTLDGHVREYRRDGEVFFADKWLKLDGTLDVDNQQDLYALKAVHLELEQMKAEVAGQFQLGKQPTVALRFNTGSMNYGDALTLLPKTYRKHTDKLNAGGQFALSGRLNGPIGQHGMPALALNFSVANGRLQNNDPPAKLTGLNGRGELTYDFNRPQAAHLKLNNVKGKLGPDAFTSSVAIRNFDDPHLALDWEGVFSLGELTRLVPDLLPNANLSGQLAGHFSTKGKLKHYKAEKVIYTTTSGELQLQNVKYAAKDNGRRVESLNGKLKFTPKAADIQQLTGIIDGNSVRFDGHLRNYLPYFFTNKGVMEADLWVRAGELRLDPWLAPDTTAKQASHLASPTPNTHDDDLGLPDRIRVNLKAEINTMRYDNLVARDFEASVQLVDRKGSIERLQFAAFGGRFNLTGSAEQRHLVLRGDIKDVDIRQFFDTFQQFGELALVGPHAHGRLTTQFNVRARATAGLEVDPKSIAASGSFSVSNGQLLDFPLFAEMAGFIKFKRLRNLDFGVCKGDFLLKDERGYLDKLHLTANRLTIDAHGSHGFDESIDYHFAIQLPRREWRESKSQDVKSWISTAEGEHIPLTLHMQATGTTEQPKFKLDRRAIQQRRKARRKAEREEFASEMKQEKEQLFGRQSEETTEDWIQE